MSTRRRELARADRVVRGLWRLRLPLPWSGIPHVNAYAIASDGGVVLVDTGMHEPGAFAQLELALSQTAMRVEDVRLLVCTHAHSDHYGQAALIVDAAGCELWMHPRHEHMTRAVEDPERQLDDLTPMLVSWGLQSVLCYLRHLELHGEAAKVEDGDVERWRAG